MFGEHADETKGLGRLSRCRAGGKGARSRCRSYWNEGKTVSWTWSGVLMPCRREEYCGRSRCGMVALFGCAGMCYDLVGLEFLKCIVLWGRWLKMQSLLEYCCEFTFYYWWGGRSVLMGGYLYTSRPTLEDARCFWHAYAPHLLVQSRSLSNFPRLRILDGRDSNILQPSLNFQDTLYPIRPFLNHPYI